MRTDTNNNPTAFTTDVAREAGLKEGVDYFAGSPFVVPSTKTTLYTAKIIGDPISVTIKLIDKLGFYTRSGNHRWMYIALPDFIWEILTYDEKRKVIGFMYEHEGGMELKRLFV